MSEDATNLKDVEFYSATVNAWYTTKFEKDKHLLSLASVGIGLLVTLATAVGISTFYTAVMYALSVLCFLVCIVSVLVVFSRNASYLESLIQGNEKDDPILGALDKTSTFSFIFGVVFTLFVGLFSSVENINLKEAVMAKEIKKNIVIGDNEKIVTSSVNGASKMKPPKSQDESSGNKTEKPAADKE